MNGIIKENETIRFRVLLEDKVLTEVTNLLLAENYMMGLPEDQRSKARIVPMTPEGKQILFG